MPQSSYAQRFKESAYWLLKMLPQIDFEKEERDYKLQFAERMRHVRDLHLDRSVDWADVFVSAVPKSNLLNWRCIDELKRFALSEPERLAALLDLLWRAKVTSSNFDAFVSGLRQFSSTFTPGVGTAVASVLLMARGPADYPPYRPEAVHRFWNAVGWPKPPSDANPYKIYSHFRRSLQVFQSVAIEDGLQVDGLGIAQGYMWMIVEWDPRTALPGRDVSAFRAWRGDSAGEAHEAPEPAAIRRAVIETIERRSEPIFREKELLNFQAGTRSVPLLDEAAAVCTPAGFHFQSPLSLRLPEPIGVPPKLVDSNGFMRHPRKSSRLKDGRDQALLHALESRVPLILLRPLGNQEYQALYPVFVNRFVHKDGEFEFDMNQVYTTAESDAPAPEYERRWNPSNTWRRVHQPVFRRDVLKAYRGRCAVCGLNIVELLDAAHIVPDHHELGIASVSNGLALCKIHHAAFDAGLLAITEDFRVAISQRIMSNDAGEAVDHALRKFHGQSLEVIPGAKNLRPRSDLLRIAIDRFDK